MKRKIATNIMIITLIISVVSLSSCAVISDKFKQIKGKLLGNSYTIYQYDNYGNQTLKTNGTSIDIAPYDATTDENGNTVTNSVLDITIDGKQILAVGNTLTFEETGIDKLAGFEEIKNFAEIKSNSGLRYIPFDNFVNDLKNKMGKKRMILVYSQLGNPIGIYQGNNVLVTVPSDLPKMTRINIDGKSLYLYRVNYTIIDSNLVK